MCNQNDYYGLKIVQGHIKAHLPDKNQVGIGTIANKAIPLISQALNGNTADSEWNAATIPLLRSVLSPNILAKATSTILMSSYHVGKT